MIWIDYAILALISIAAVMGLLRGLAVEMFALGIWLIAAIIGLTFSNEFAAHFTVLSAQSPIRLAAASGSLCLLTILVGGLIGYLLNESLMVRGFSFFSRLLGSFLGVIRGGVITTIIILLAGMTPLPFESWWQESQLVFPFQKLALLLSNCVPAGVAEHIRFK